MSSRQRLVVVIYRSLGHDGMVAGGRRERRGDVTPTVVLVTDCHGGLVGVHGRPVVGNRCQLKSHPVAAHDGYTDQEAANDGQAEVEGGFLGVHGHKAGRLHQWVVVEIIHDVLIFLHICNCCCCHIMPDAIT